MLRACSDKLPYDGTANAGRDGSVDMATRYGLNGSGIESRWGREFQTGPGAHPASYTIGTGSFLGVKRSGRGVNHPPEFSPEFKATAELYVYSPSGPL